MPSAPKRRDRPKGDLSLGLLSIVQNEKQALTFARSDPLFFRSFFQALGLTFRPEAKDLEELVKHDDVFQAWMEFIQVAYQNPTFLLQLAKQIPATDSFGRTFAKEYIHRLFQTGVIRPTQAGGGFSVRQILLFLIALAAVVYSSLSAYDVFTTGRAGTNPVASTLGYISGAIGELADDTPLVAPVAKAAKSLSRALHGLGEEESRIPKRLLDTMVVLDTSEVAPYKEKVSSLFNVERTLGLKEVKAAVSIPRNRGFPSVEAWHARAKEEQERLTAQLETEEKELARLEEYSKKCQTAAQLKGADYLLMQRSLMSEPGLYMLGTRELADAIRVQEEKVAAIRGPQRTVSQELLAFEQRPASLPFLSQVEGFGPVLQQTIGRQIDSLSFDILGLSSLNEDDAEIKDIHRSIEAIVQRASKIENMNPKVLIWLEQTLQREVYLKLIANVQAERAIHQGAIHTIQARLGWMDEEALIHIVKDIATQRNFALTEEHRTYVTNMLAEMEQYGLSVRAAEREDVANSLITLFKGGVKKIDLAYINQVEGRVFQLTAPRLKRAQAASLEFLMCLVLAGIPIATIFWMMGMKADGAPPEQVIRHIQEAAPGGFPMLPGYPMAPGYAMLPAPTRASSRGRAATPKRRRGSVAAIGTTQRLAIQNEPQGGGTRRRGRTQRRRRV